MKPKLIKLVATFAFALTFPLSAFAQAQLLTIASASGIDPNPIPESGWAVEIRVQGNMATGTLGVYTVFGVTRTLQAQENIAQHIADPTATFSIDATNSPNPTYAAGFMANMEVNAQTAITTFFNDRTNLVNQIYYSGLGWGSLSEVELEVLGTLPQDEYQAARDKAIENTAKASAAASGSSWGNTGAGQWHGYDFTYTTAVNYVNADGLNVMVVTPHTSTVWIWVPNSPNGQNYEA